MADIYADLQDALSAATKQSDYIEQCRKILGCIEEHDIVSVSKLASTLPAAGYTKELRAVIKTLKENALVYLTSLSLYLKQKDMMKELFALFDTFLSETNRTKRITGKLTFRDVQKMALKALREQRDLRVQENEAYDRIMIDEFQDNNGENRDLLFLLCSPPKDGNNPVNPTVQDIAKDKLFFVGDEKQSIYKFRGADVAVFNELKTDFGEDNLLSMEYNYRSTNALLTSFNTLFGGVNGENGIFEREPTETYEAGYKLSAKKIDTNTRKDLPAQTLTADTVPIHVCLLNKKHFSENDTALPDEKVDYLDESEQTAYFIAKKIAELKKENSDEKFSDIAILEKSRTHRAPLIKWLNAFGIPYTVDQNASMFSSGLVFDLYNFLRLCVYPSDRTAYAAYLTSPLAGLSENATETILAEDTALSAEEQKRFEAAEHFLSEQRMCVLSQPLTTTLETLWDTAGYRYETMLSKRAELSAEQFDLLYELARQCDADGKSVAWFVDQLALLHDKEKSSFADDADLDAKEVTYPVEKLEGVQILTIHKSKGLQYKHVFITGCIGARNKSAMSVLFFDEHYGLSIKPEKGAPNYFVQIQQEIAKKKERAEFKRLLYVAITRAEQDVFIVGTFSNPKTQRVSSEDAVNLKVLEKQMDIFYPAWKDDDLLYAAETPAYNDGAPFDFLQFIPALRSEQNEMQKEKSQAQTRAALISELIPAYSATTPVTTEHEILLRTTPSALEHTDETILAFPAPKTDPYAKTVNSVIEKYDAKTTLPATQADPDSAAKTEYAGVLQNAVFSYADFGTICHACLEAAAKGTPPNAFMPETKLFKTLSENEQSIMLAAAQSMAEAFQKTQLGLALKKTQEQGRFFKAEYAFRTMLKSATLRKLPLAETNAVRADEEYLVTGSIDLLFEDPDSAPENPVYNIVDYKSDQIIRPEMYYAQQACYRTAAARLLGCEESAIRCYLYYLRYDETLEITEYVPRA